MAKKLIKKAQDGTELRKGQYKRVGRIAEKNPERAMRVADRMNTRASRVDRGKEIAGPSKMEKIPMEERKYDLDLRKMKMDAMKNKDTMKKGGVVKKKAKMGSKITKKK
jgi:hypothetical protein